MMAALSVTYLLSILLQNLLCCIPIVAVLRYETAAIIFQENYLYKTETVFYISL